MKFTAEAAPLAAALTRAAETAGDGKVIPILGHVLIQAEAEREGLVLTATDLDRATTERVQVSVQATGSTTVPAKILAEIARKMPAGAQITARLDDDVLHVSGGRARYRLPTLPVSEFSDWTGGDLDHQFEIPAAELHRMICKTEFAISDEETRYYLNGIYLHVIEGKLRVVATDGHKLARYDGIDLPINFPGVIVPRGTVSILKRLLTKRDDEVRVELSATRIRITVGATVLTSKLIDGSYPDYARVIPTNKKELRVATADFREAFDRVAIVASVDKPGVKVELGNGSQGVTLSTAGRSDDRGWATEQVEGQYGGGPLTTGVNPRFVRDVFAQIDTDETTILLDSASSPILIVDGQALFVVMPLSVG